MAKEKPVKQETEEQTAIRKEIRKEWGSMEPKLLEMAHKLEVNGFLSFCALIRFCLV